MSLARYAGFDHAGWMERAIGCTLTPFQRRVVTILGLVGGGIYNAPIQPRKIDWSHGGAVRVIWRGALATADWNDLTRLVLLCHAARIRCEIQARAPHCIAMVFTERSDAPDMMNGHPDITTALARFDRAIPADHPVRFAPLGAHTGVLTAAKA